MKPARIQPLPFVDADDRDVEVSPLGLSGIINIPESAQMVAICPGGTASGRFSPRTSYLASVLRRSGIGTLLIDLLTNAEDGKRENVFDVVKLADRLTICTRWLREEGAFGDRPIAAFPFGTAAAAALIAAARDPALFTSIVCRSGRVDLAGKALEDLRTPVMLIAGGMDHDVLAVNRRVHETLTVDKDLRVIPGASQLYEEAGTLDLAIGFARDWMLAHKG